MKPRKTDIILSVLIQGKAHFPLSQSIGTWLSRANFINHQSERLFLSIWPTMEKWKQTVAVTPPRQDWLVKLWVLVITLFKCSTLLDSFLNSQLTHWHLTLILSLYPAIIPVIFNIHVHSLTSMLTSASFIPWTSSLLSCQPHHLTHSSGLPSLSGLFYNCQQMALIGANSIPLVTKMLYLSGSPPGYLIIPFLFLIFEPTVSVGNYIQLHIIVTLLEWLTKIKIFFFLLYH